MHCVMIVSASRNDRAGDQIQAVIIEADDHRGITIMLKGGLHVIQTLRLVHRRRRRIDRVWRHGCAARNPPSPRAFGAFPRSTIGGWKPDGAADRWCVRRPRPALRLHRHRFRHRAARGMERWARGHRASPKAICISCRRSIPGLCTTTVFDVGAKDGKLSLAFASRYFAVPLPGRRRPGQYYGDARSWAETVSPADP